MKNPFIPQRIANVSIIDGRADKKIVTHLKNRNITVVETIKCNDIQESISYHPDVVLHPINHNTIIVAPNVFDYYDDKLSRLGINLIKGETILSSKYPDDIAYNVGRLDGIAIHNFKYTDEKLKFYFKKENIDMININQGYSKCSLAIIDGISGITSDNFMYKRLINLGYNMLLIKPGFIKLENEKYGFIGGATGNLSAKEVVFSGSMSHHPDYHKIVDFINFRNIKIEYLSNDYITDMGTIMSFYC